MSWMIQGVRCTTDLLKLFSSAGITLLLLCNDDRIRHLYIKRSDTDTRDGAVCGIQSIEVTARNEIRVSYMIERSRSIRRIFIRNDTLYISGMVRKHRLWCYETYFSALFPC